MYKKKSLLLVILVIIGIANIHNNIGKVFSIDQNIIKTLKRIDKQLSDLHISHTYYMTPLSSSLQKEKEIFEEAYSKSEKYNPQFTYPDYDKDYLLRTIKDLKNVKINSSSISNLFTDLRNKYVNEIKLILARNKNEITKYSTRIFPMPDSQVIEDAYNYLSSVKKEELISEIPELTSSQLKSKIEAILNELNLSKWKVILSADKLARLCVDCQKNNVYIRLNDQFDERFSSVYITHEIYGHVLRYENSKKYKWSIVNHGTSMYEYAEEGIAMYLESVKNQDIFYPTRLHLICGHIIAIDVALRGDFYEVYSTLKKFNFSDLHCFDISTLVKSGFEDTSKYGVYTKGATFYVGYKQVKEYLYSNKLEDLFICRTSIHELDSVKKLLEIQ